jgi:tetratricopeptide (TPR) repeat protein
MAVYRGFSLVWMRRYAQALSAYNETLAIAPGNVRAIQEKAMVFLAEGDLAGAKAWLAGQPAEVSKSDLVLNLGSYWDRMWVFDEAQRRLFLSLPAEAFGGYTAAMALCFDQVHALTGNTAELRRTSEEAERAFSEQLRQTPDDAQLHVLRGEALAFLGRRDEAIREGERGAALVPIGRDAYTGAYVQHQLVRIYMILGEQEKALDLLEPLLKIPYYLSAGWLSIDPNFAPLKGNPRFEKLLRGKA